jgi:hypothetical protein
MAASLMSENKKTNDVRSHAWTHIHMAPLRITGLPMHAFFQSAQYRRRLSIAGLRRQRGDNFFKTRVAAQRIPERIEPDLPIGNACGESSERF